MTSRAPRRCSVAVQAALAVAVLAGKAQAAVERWIEEPAPAAVRVETSDIDGPVYADARGMTIYTWSRDTPGVSFCNADRYGEVQGRDGIGQPKMYVMPEAERRPTCEQVWVPVRPAADAAPVGQWSIMKRRDGSQQWAYQGTPLYTYALDDVPGAVNGVGKDTPVTPGNRAGRKPLAPRLANPDSVMVQVFPHWGRVMRTVDRNVLYVKSAKAKKETERAFAPFLAPELAQPLGDWTLVSLKSGDRQWAYRGDPLYTPVIDKSRIEGPPDFMHGNSSWAPVRLIAEDIPGWNPLIVQKAPQPPANVTVERTAAGDVLADSHGKTLYAFSCTEAAADSLSCDNPGASPFHRYAECGGPDLCAKRWQRLEAPANAKASNHSWSIAAVDKITGRFAKPGDANAERIWLYRGRTLYTFAEDVKPGDIRAQYIQTDGWDYYYLRLLSTSSSYDPAIAH